MKTKKEYKVKVVGLDFDRIDVTDEFVIRNNLGLKRTQAELIAIMKSKRSEFMSFWPDILADYLTKRSILKLKGLFNEEYIKKVESSEVEVTPIKDLYESAQDFLDYMVFAWGKALDRRGLSASRSIDKLSAWMWLLGREDLSELLNRQDLYNPYGTPALVVLCKELGIIVPNELVEFSHHEY